MATQLKLVPAPQRAVPSRRLSAEPLDSDETYAPLAAVVSEMDRDLIANGVLVAWHEHGRSPKLLFSGGDCKASSAAEQEMLEVAADAADSAGGPVRWTLARRSSARAMLTTRIGTATGIVTVTRLFRRVAKASRLIEIESALRTLPMVEAFFRLWALSARTMAGNRGLTAALDSSDVPTLLTGTGARLVFANAAAETLIARKDGLRRAGSVLSGISLADTVRLHAAIEHVGNGSRGNPAPVVVLQRVSGRPLLVAVVPAPGGGEGVGAATAIVQVFDPDQNLEMLLAPVCRLYGLSRVEGQLASLLASGALLTDAAKEMRVQEQTARSYLKQIFLKTETNRQAELVWLMLQSAVRLAPGHPVQLV